MNIGFITSHPSKLQNYFPTSAEPNFIPTEPPFTPDDQIAVNELRKNGFTVNPIVWGTEISLLKQYNLLIVRSPWDYMDNVTNKNNFISWINDIEKSNILLANPAKLINWMLDKHYLHDLYAENISVIPTEYLEIGITINLEEVYKQKGEFILKPCISAAGKGLFYITSLNDAKHYQQVIDQQLETSSYMLQDFVPEIKTHGEWSLIFLGGKYSHAIHKKPAPDSILVHAERGGELYFNREPSSSLINYAKEVYDKVFSACKNATGFDCDKNLLLYLRTDLIETKNGPVLIECEGVEPELFFRANPSSGILFRESIAQIKM